jgi:hypothetical protein
MPLREAIESRYPHANERIFALRESVIAACQRYIDAGLGDRNAERRLCSLDDWTYWQQLAEVLVAHQLQLAGLRFFHPAEGPDFCVEHEGRRIWIEVITPTPANIPEAWLAPPGGGVRDFPHEAILLRWTAAIKEKAEKLLGNDRGLRGYLAAGVVAADDAYVIAIIPRSIVSMESANFRLPWKQHSLSAHCRYGLIAIILKRVNLSISDACLFLNRKAWRFRRTPSLTIVSLQSAQSGQLISTKEHCRVKFRDRLSSTIRWQLILYRPGCCQPKMSIRPVRWMTTIISLSASMADCPLLTRWLRQLNVSSRKL